MIKVRLFVNIKPSVYDPQSEVITTAAKNLGYQTISDIIMGKFFDVELKNDQNVEKTITDLAQELLVNFNLETYRYEIMEER